MDTITEFYTEWFCVCRNIASKFRIIAIFISVVKQNNDSNKTCKYVHYILLYQSSCECNGSWLVSIKQRMNFNCNRPPTFVFLVCHKNGLNIGCSYFEILPANNTSFPPRWLVQVLHPCQKSERSPFWNGSSYVSMASRATFNGMTSYWIFTWIY
jgi:hypothetical protein